MQSENSKIWYRLFDGFSCNLKIPDTARVSEDLFKSWIFDPIRRTFSQLCFYLKLYIRYMKPTLWLNDGFRLLINKLALSGKESIAATNQKKTRNNYFPLFFETADELWKPKIGLNFVEQLRKTLPLQTSTLSDSVKQKTSSTLKNPPDERLCNIVENNINTDSWHNPCEV